MTKSDPTKISRIDQPGYRIPNNREKGFHAGMKQKRLLVANQKLTKTKIGLSNKSVYSKYVWGDFSNICHRFPSSKRYEDKRMHLAKSSLNLATLGPWFQSPGAVGVFRLSVRSQPRKVRSSRCQARLRRWRRRCRRETARRPRQSGRCCR